MNLKTRVTRQSAVILEVETGKQTTFSADAHPDEYQAIYDMAVAGDVDSIRDWYEDYQVDSNFTIDLDERDGIVYYNGEPLPNYLAKQLMNNRDNLDDDKMESLLAFNKRLEENPSFDVVNRLYIVLESFDMPITEDGHFLAWKSVRTNYMDHHTGTFDNSPGKTPEEARHLVDDKNENGCSKGLHVATENYARNFAAGRIVQVKVDPRDVVCVPNDGNFEKMRVCRYEVLADVT